MIFSLFGDNGNSSPRTLGIRDKQILYRNAKGRCENPGCKKKIDFDEMQVGHKTAYSRGGRTSFKNSVCLCYRCNKLQGTDSWVVFLTKQGMKAEENPKAKVKRLLQSKSVSELKILASKHKVKVRGTAIDDLWSGTHTNAPTKSQYISKLASVLTLTDLSKPARKTIATRPKAKSIRNGKKALR